ncbi:MAG: cysteine--tRNA ligase [Candidatus Omnitrophica bacterium]|nr:cysteine--tRNA ligase [Candidatus Omnitrophota bacterium]
MPIQLYNSLTRKKEEFAPVNPPEVNIYTCGVTVYDESHIGHARSLFCFDLVRRYLRFRGYGVRFVRNITDIDDKIINRANELKTDWKDLVRKYIARYYEDLECLGIEKGDFEPRATENIPDMVKYIESLINKGFAYEVGGDVYFNVRKFSSYGQLSGQGIDAMETGTRIEANEQKRDHLDFALWKSSKENEPSWDSPWGKGRPGWHIECSVMSQKFLKTDTLDIHAGGRDLIFPHHENEIAQAEALTGKPFAKYWLHGGLLTIDGQKMAKSSGNFVTIRNFLGKYPAGVLKLFFLQTHYSQPIDFTWAAMEEKRSALDRIMIFLKTLERREKGIEPFTRTNLKNILSPVELKNIINDFRQDFIDAMDDDFNSPQAVGALFEIITASNKILCDRGFTEAHLEPLSYARDVVLELGGILGLDFSPLKPALAEDEIDKLISLRQDLKNQKKFDEADRIKKELLEKNIVLEDIKGGKTLWRVKV